MELFRLFGTIALNGVDETKREIDNVSDKADEASDGIDRMGDSATKTASGGYTMLKNVASNLVSEGLQRVISAVGQFVRDGVNFQSQIEQYTTSFTVMTGSAEKAAEVTKRLKEIGAATPFELTDLADTTQLLMNYGFTADSAIESMQMLGDISQGSADKMNRIAAAYGQMSSAGKVSLEDIKQMIEAGFNPLQEISETTGESMASLYDRVSKGTISIDEITASMERSTSEGGKYFGSMDAQSKTLEGRMSTLKDTINNAVGTVFSGLLKKAADEYLPAVTEAIEKVDWEGFATRAGEAFNSIQSGVGWIVENFKPENIIPESMLPRIEEFKTNIEGMFSGIKSDVIDDFQSKMQPLQDLFTKLKDAMEPIATFYLTDMMNKFETFVSIVETVVIPALSGVVQFFIDLATPIVEKCQPAIEKLNEVYTKASNTMKDLWFNTLKPVFDEFVQMITEVYEENKDVFDKIGTLFETVFNAIASVVTWFYETIIVGGLIPAIQWLSDFVSENMGTIKQLFSNAFDTIGAIIDVFVSLFKGDWEGMWSAIQTIIENAKENMVLQFELVKSFFLKIWNSIKQKLTEIILNIVKGIVEKFEKAKADLTKTVEQIKTSISTKIESMKEKVLGVFDKLKDGIKTRIENAKTIVSNVADAMKKLFNWDFKIPKIKLPHFSISPSGWKVGDLLEGVKPTLGIEWYAKGGVMEDPTVFGRNGNNLMVGGEAGAEAIAPISTLQKYIEESVANQNSEMVDVLYKILAAIISMDDEFASKMRKALGGTSLTINDREFARLVAKAVN